LADVSDHCLLRPEFALQPFASCLGMQAYGGGVQRTADGQGFGEQLGTQAVRDQPGELALEVPRLRCGPFRQGRGQRTERARRLWLTGALVPARTAQVQGAEQRAGDNGLRVLVSSWSATVGTRHLL